MPDKIKGRSRGYETGHWLTGKYGDQKDMAVVNQQLMGLIDMAVSEAYGDQGTVGRSQGTGDSEKY